MGDEAAPIEFASVQRATHGDPVPPSKTIVHVAETEISEASGMGRVAFRLLIWLSRAYAPRREQPAGKFQTAADREEGIPDELYTLW